MSCSLSQATEFSFTLEHYTGCRVRLESAGERIMQFHMWPSPLHMYIIEKQLTGRGGLVFLQGSCFWPCLCQPCTPAPWWSSSRSSWFSCTTIVLQDCSPFRAKEADMSYLHRRLYSNQLGGVSPSSFSTFTTLSRQAWVVTRDLSLPQGNC